MDLEQKERGLQRRAATLEARRTARCRGRGEVQLDELKAVRAEIQQMLGQLDEKRRSVSPRWSR